jgi:hypothetical protein
MAWDISKNKMPCKFLLSMACSLNSLDKIWGGLYEHIILWMKLGLNLPLQLG